MAEDMGLESLGLVRGGDPFEVSYVFGEERPRTTGKWDWKDGQVWEKNCDGVSFEIRPRDQLQKSRNDTPNREKSRESL